MSNKFTGLGLFAAGVGIGAAVALLYAPRAGKHTRTRLRNSANRTLHRVDEIRQDVRSRMAEIVDETSDTIASAIAYGKETTKVSSECIQDTVKKVRDRMNEGRERVEEYVRSFAS
jgi:gas vesicle protein